MFHVIYNSCILSLLQFHFVSTLDILDIRYDRLIQRMFGCRCLPTGKSDSTTRQRSLTRVQLMFLLRYTHISRKRAHVDKDMTSRKIRKPTMTGLNPESDENTDTLNLH